MDYFLALYITIVYFLYKFIEVRFILKEKKEMKLIIIDSIKVMICALIALFIIEQFNFTKDVINSVKGTQPIAFLDNPDF